MSCLRSFCFLSSANENASGANIDTWGLAPQNYWLYQSGAGTSTFNIEGFKNINVYGIEAVGFVYCLDNLGYSQIVNDWGFNVQINGQNPLVSGNITVAPNRFSIQKQSNQTNISLSKNYPKFNLEDPIQSATSIQITGLRASGIGAENLTILNIAWDVNFIVYYKYEGE